MHRKSGTRARILTAILILMPLCFSQSRQSTQRSRPPFLQQATLFEESISAPFVTKLVLRNGLTVLVEEFKSKPVVSIQTHIRAGSFNETAQNRGAAHLIASLVCRRPADKISGPLEQNIYALGGSLRKSVGHENTQFEIVARSAQWKRALNLQFAALMNPSFDPADWQAEAGLLVSETQSVLDDPDEFSKEKLLELAYDSASTRNLGDIADGRWQGLKSEAISGFFRAFYVPSRISVVITGDVVASEVLNEIVRLYGNQTATSKADPVPAKTFPTGFRFRVVRGDISVPRMLLGFRIHPANASDLRVLDVLRALVGLGEASILKYRLRDQEKLIWDGQTSIVGSRNFGLFVIRMEMDPQHIDRSQIGVLTEIELLKREAVGEADLARAVAQLESEYWERLDSVTGRARSLAQFDAGGDWKGRERYVSDLKKVSPTDIKRVAEKYLRLENCALLEFLPEEGIDPRNPTAEGALSTLEGLLEPSVDQLYAKRQQETAPFLKIPRDTAYFKFNEIQYPYQVASILRGPEMYVREDHTAPVLTLGIFFPGGKFAENKGNAGITKLMTDLIVRGTPDMRSARYSHQIELYGGKVEPVVKDDYFGLHFSILSPHFEAGFSLLRQAVKTPVFEKEDVDRQKEIQIRAMRHRKSSGGNAWDLMHQALFQEFSYSMNGLGTEESLAGITPAALMEWHGEYVKNRKPFVVIIGDTKGTSLAMHFVKEFSGSRMQEVKLPDSWVKPLSKGASIERSWKKKHSVILVGFQGPPMDDEDVYAAIVLETLVGHTSRLAKEIRYGSGAAQAVSLMYEPRQRGGSMIAYAISSPENEEAALKEVRDELMRIAAGPNTYRDCQSAVNAAMGMYEIRNQGRIDQIQRIMDNLLAGRGIGGFQNIPASLQNINEIDLTEMAQRLFNIEKAAVVKLHGRPN